MAHRFTDQAEIRYRRSFFIDIFDTVLPEAFDELLKSQNALDWTDRYKFSGSWMAKVAEDTLYHHANGAARVQIAPAGERSKEEVKKLLALPIYKHVRGERWMLKSPPARIVGDGGLDLSVFPITITVGVFPGQLLNAYSLEHDRVIQYVEGILTDLRNKAIEQHKLSEEFTRYPRLAEKVEAYILYHHYPYSTTEIRTLESIANQLDKKRTPPPEAPTDRSTVWRWIESISRIMEMS